MCTWQGRDDGSWLKNDHCGSFVSLQYVTKDYKLEAGEERVGDWGDPFAEQSVLQMLGETIRQQA